MSFRLCPASPRGSGKGEIWIWCNITWRRKCGRFCGRDSTLLCPRTRKKLILTMISISGIAALQSRSHWTYCCYWRHIFAASLAPSDLHAMHNRRVSATVVTPHIMHAEWHLRGALTLYGQESILHQGSKCQAPFSPTRTNSSI